MKMRQQSTTKKTDNVTINSTVINNHECPPDIGELGRATWSLLHTIAATYPSTPSDIDRQRANDFLTLLGVIYPCSHCADELRTDLNQHPPDTQSQSTFTQWMCQLHNRVNERLGKPKFDCARVDERWRDGWKDGSCG
jgi:FAD-linked sulfhydryl oxidase